jgi:predicted RNase H-like HicB family nuclease
MKELKIIIERSSDYYDAYAHNCPGVYGAGDTVEATKENILEGLKLFVEHQKYDDLPEILRSDYRIVFKFDTQSFLNYYDKIFSKVALEHLTGINQKQLHHYASGLKKPRPEQRKKIESALHRLGEELLAVEL